MTAASIPGRGRRGGGSRARRRRAPDDVCLGCDYHDSGCDDGTLEHCVKEERERLRVQARLAMCDEDQVVMLSLQGMWPATCYWCLERWECDHPHKEERPFLHPTNSL